MQNLLTMEEGAYFRGRNGKLYCGTGPFLPLSSPPATGPAFYINDYKLSDPRPWKVPAALDIITPAENAVPQTPEKLFWHVPDSTSFAEVFHDMQDKIQNGQLQKAVPVVTETATIPDLSPYRDYLLQAFSTLEPPLHSYAWWNRQGGFAGATPEWLFELSGSRLTTMALAGTARKEDAPLFSLDRKEIREHEYVVQSIMEKLSAYGNTTRMPRETIDLKNLIHFLSIVSVDLERETPLNELIRRLHPTPALGPLPRTKETLALQYEWREKLHCPTSFGAPFGFLYENNFSCLVAIRGIFMERNKLFLPAGCGIISESKLTQEWNELQLKRQSVRRNLGLEI